MLPIDDDPELTKLAMEANAALEEEIDSLPADASGIAPVTSVEDVIKASRGLDLTEDLARLDANADLGFPEEFETEIEDIKVAENLADFRDAVAIAEMNGLDSIQASKKVIFHFTKPHYPKNNYFFYHGIRIDEAGKTEEIEKFLAMTTEEVNFGKGR